MQTILNIQGQFFSCDLTQPIDISLPITAETGAASAWHCLALVALPYNQNRCSL